MKTPHIYQRCMHAACLALVVAATPAKAAYPEWWSSPKPGLWQMDMNMAGRQFSNKQCVTDSMLSEWRNKDAQSAGQGCAAGNYQREGSNVYVARYACTGGDITVRATQVDSNNIRIETSGSHKGKAQTMVTQWHYLGICQK